MAWQQGDLASDYAELRTATSTRLVCALAGCRGLIRGFVFIRTLETRTDFVVRSPEIEVYRAAGSVVEDQHVTGNAGVVRLFDRERDLRERARNQAPMPVKGRVGSGTWGCHLDRDEKFKYVIYIRIKNRSQYHPGKKLEKLATRAHPRLRPSNKHIHAPPPIDPARRPYATACAPEANPSANPKAKSGHLK